MFEQGARGNTFDRWIGLHDIPDVVVVQKMVEAYRAHEPVLSPFPEVPVLLGRLHLKYKLGLLSDGRLEVQRRKLRALGFAAYFDAVVFSDEWGESAWKPSTVPFRAVVERLGTPAYDVVYVADNPAKDFKGAKEIGMATVWVRQTSGIYAQAEPAGPKYAPDVTVGSLSELESIIPTLSAIRRRSPA